MISLRNTFYALCSIPLLGCSAVAQSQPESCAPTLLRRDKPAVYITFDHFEDSQARSGDKKTSIWLHISNNSTCPLEIPVDQRRPASRFARDEKGAFVKLPSGGLKIDSGNTLANGAKEPIIYSLFNNGEGRGRIGNIYDDSISSGILISGASALFQVRLSDIQKNWSLFIEALYQGHSFNRDHFRVYFDFNDLPAEALKKIAARR